MYVCTYVCVCLCRASLLGSRKKSDMMVLLEREDGKYTAGETVRGRVHIILTQDVSVKGLRRSAYTYALYNETRSSADADNRFDAFSGQSRSTNMVRSTCYI